LLIQSALDRVDHGSDIDAGEELLVRFVEHVCVSGASVT
jgi:hypothetical protein